MTDLTTLYDVAIVGGGMMGYATAIVCAQAGLSTIVLERRQTLGWEATRALQLAWRGARSSTGDALEQAMLRAGGLANGRLDAPILEMVLDRELARLGVRLLYGCQPLALSIHQTGVLSMALGAKARDLVICARAYVDATENASLSRLAGGPGAGSASSAYFTIILHDLDQPSALPEPFVAEGVKVTAAPGVWPGELVLTCSLPTCEMPTALRCLPAILTTFRAAAPAWRRALVTNISSEPFPLSPGAPPSAPGDAALPPNVFTVAPWPIAEHDTGCDLPRCLELGERLGRHVRAWLARTGAPLTPARPPAAISAPPSHHSDVLVCGGGTAGAIAAIAAARNGARTSIVEATSCLGGIGTLGGMHVYYHGLPGGLQNEVDERVRQLGDLFGPRHRYKGFHTDAKKVVLQQMADEAGVTIYYDTTIISALVHDVPSHLPAARGQRPQRQIRGVVGLGPAGASSYTADVIIDSTGDGDVAYLAGAICFSGRDSDGAMDKYSLSASKLLKDGTLTSLNFDAGYCDATDIVDVTRARRVALSQYWHDCFTPETRLARLPVLLGIRSSRQVLGEYTLTFSDQLTSRQFPDTIGYATANYDSHSWDYENESDEAMLWVWLLGNWPKMIGSEIPLRTMLPRGVDGLLVACRALSVTHDAHQQLRMMRDMQRVGEAAGVAAAVAVQLKVQLRCVPVAEIQRLLMSTGALGSPVALSTSLALAQAVHVPERLPAAPPAFSLEQWVAALGSDNTDQAVWQLYNAGSAAIPHCQQLVAYGNERQRFWAAVVLSMLKQEHAVPTLLAAVRSRYDERIRADRARPTWHAAVVLLGRVGSPEAVSVIANVINEPDVRFDLLIACLRALGRIGSDAAADAVEAVLARGGLPERRLIQHANYWTDRFGYDQPEVTEDARWYIELTAAQALARCGRPRRDLVEPHTHDERAYVRRYAERVQQLLDGA